MGASLVVFKEGRKARQLEWGEQEGEWEELSQRDNISSLLFGVQLFKSWMLAFSLFSWKLLDFALAASEDGLTFDPAWGLVELGCNATFHQQLSLVHLMPSVLSFSSPLSHKHFSSAYLGQAQPGSWAVTASQI